MGPSLMKICNCLFAAIMALSLPVPAAAQWDAADPATGISHSVEQPVITHHRGVFGGVGLHYTATVEAIPVRVGSKGEGADKTADVVSFSYVRDGVDAARRPVLFLFNGGPIVASPYVHIGGLGPKRIAFPDDVKADPSSFKLVENPYSPLDAVDLVFVDPATTGFSRVTGTTKPSDFFSNEADAAQISAFIRRWLARHDRQASPVYLFGESYGTHRAAAVAAQLAGETSPSPLAGIFLYGQAVNVIEWSQRPANVTSYVASLPTLAAIAWYHRKVDQRGLTLAQFVGEASAYAKGDYLHALYQGSALSAAERQVVAARLEGFSGIPAAWYMENGLRITKERYRTELFKAEGLLIGRSDARYMAPLTDEGGRPDPADVLADAIVATFKDYMREELKVARADDYLFDSPVSDLDGWGWGSANIGPFSDWPYYEGIAKAMKINPTFRLVVGNGFYDTMTTLGGAELLVNQSGFDRSRVTLRYYDGGHMGYSVTATARAIGDDIRAMVR